MRERSDGGSAELQPSPQLLEAASWRVVTEVVRRYPNRLAVVETHPGGGQYDCLEIFERGATFERAISLNRAGSVHIQPFTEDRQPVRWATFWDDFLTASDPRDLVRRLVDTAGLPKVAAVPASTPVTLSYRVIAAFLSQAVFGRTRWECRNGYEDTSGSGGGRERWFNAWPEAAVMACKPRDDDPLGIGAYRFWFLLRDHEPVACLNTDGDVWNDLGHRWKLGPLYATERRIWPVITTVFGRLLP